MENKKLTIFENDKIKERVSIKGTSIVLKETGTGKVLFRGSNKVIVSGSELNAIKDFDFDNFTMSNDNGFLDSIPSYDEAFLNAGHPFRYSNGVNTPVGISEIMTSSLKYNNAGVLAKLQALSMNDEQAQKLYQHLARRVCLWCVGINGCGVEASRVFKVVNTKWISPYGYNGYNDGTGGNNTYNSIETCLIPFKYRTTDADLSEAYRRQYYGRSEIGTTAIGYFFKTFDENPTLIRRYADDSAFLSEIEDVWADTRAAEAEVVVQLKMSVSVTDCREYFNRNVSVNDSKINTISLCSAVPYLRTSDNTDYIEYLDIRPFTKFNFPNEALIDTSKGIDITYYLYY